MSSGGAGLMRLANHLREKNRAALEKLRDRKGRIYQNRIRTKKAFQFNPYSQEYQKTLRAQLAREKKTRKIISALVALISVGISVLIFWLAFH